MNHSAYTETVCHSLGTDVVFVFRRRCRGMTLQARSIDGCNLCQELSRGIVNLQNARKIADFPFPYPYAQAGHVI